MPRKNNKKSGYISNPPRIQLYKYDNSTGSYPTVLRSGDVDRSGMYTRSFDDTKTHVFGKRIFDEFDTSGEESTTVFNAKKWVNSSGMLIRNEISNISGQIVKDKCAVFEGAGDAEGRWIRTKEKIRNPIIEFYILQGPYNNIKNGLKLGNPKTTEVLNIQYSFDGTTWVTIKTITPSKVLKSFYESKTNKLQQQPRKLVRLTASDFNNTSEFYVRWIQKAAAITNTNKKVWAISKIDIESINQSVRYPLLINHTNESGKFVDKNMIITPHTKSDLISTGRTLKGVSDKRVNFESGQGFGPFNENTSVGSAGNDFLSMPGIDSNVYPGYSQKIEDKTKFVIDLTPRGQTEFGYARAVSATFGDLASSEDGQQLMVYWNNVNKKWEKIAQPLTSNAKLSGKGNVDKALTNLRHVLTSSAFGFSPVGIIASGSTKTSTNSLLRKEALGSFARPTDIANFPFGGQYHATSSQVIKARDIGINHPFLLEATSIVFNAALEVAGADSGTANYGAFSTGISYTHSGNPSAFASDTSCKIIIPTFFILRQFKDSFSHQKSFKVNYKTTGNTIEYSHSSKIPDYYNLVSGSSNLTYVDKSRELVTYKQAAFMLSSSQDYTITPILIPSFSEILDGGLSRDLNVIVDNYNHTTIFSLTGSFVINSKCKISPKIEPNTIYRISASHATQDEILVGNSTGGRSRGNLDASSRALFNGYPAFSKGKDFKLPSPKSSDLPLDYITPKFDDLEKESSYIIFPDDSLILGWQYPVEYYGTKYNIVATDTAHNSMTLLGDSKLTLYGSLIRANKEIHNTVNQNLSSDNLHEIIGAEAYLDEFQINTRNEFTGSYIDHLPIYNPGGGGTYTIGYDSVETNPVTKLSNRTYIGSTINKKASLAANSIVLSAGSTAGQKSSIQRFVNLSSQKIKKKDNSFKLKYYFDYKKYGNYFNMIKQSNDTKFIFDDSGLRNNKEGLFSDSPIKVNFVEEYLVGDDIKVKSYRTLGSSAQLSKVNFQSSNLSTACTSSLPYDDINAPTNRTYTVTGDFVAV
jgi:hypothetical protein